MPPDVKIHKQKHLWFPTGAFDEVLVNQAEQACSPKWFTNTP
jgi:hypothetical protein